MAPESARTAADAEEMLAILASRDEGCGRLMEVNCDSWLLKDARVKEKIDSVRWRPRGLKYESVLDETDAARGESFGGGGGGTSSSFWALALRYFSKSVSAGRELCESTDGWGWTASAEGIVSSTRSPVSSCRCSFSFASLLVSVSAGSEGPASDSDVV